MSISHSFPLFPFPCLSHCCLAPQTDVVDDIPTVKFVYIQWIGEATKIMAKASVTTHKGGVEEVFSVSPTSINEMYSAETNSLGRGGGGGGGRTLFKCLCKLFIQLPDTLLMAYFPYET